MAWYSRGEQSCGSLAFLSIQTESINSIRDSFVANEVDQRIAMVAPAPIGIPVDNELIIMFLHLPFMLRVSPLKNNFASPHLSDML